MFKELQPLLATRSLVLIISATKDEQITVNVIPKATTEDKDADKALLTPLAITATADELDSQLAEAITEYTTSYKTVAEQVAATKAAMKAAADAAEQKRKDDAEAAKNKNKAKHVPPAAKKPEPAKPEEKKEEAAAPSLFDTPAEEPEEVFEP